jgi:carbamoyl-phosphate synthase small subunit
MGNIDTAYLALEDGTVYEGRAFASPGIQVGEVVFNTSMAGYQEILTDPSYCRQIVTMTYPLIGNYGINPDDLEAAHPWVDGFIVKEYCPYPSNWRSELTLGEWLTRHGIIGVEGVDTRAITKRLRVQGSMRGCLGVGVLRPDDLIERAQEWPGMAGLDCVPLVTRKETSNWTSGLYDVLACAEQTPREPRHHVVAYDFGCKQNILRLLVHHGCSVTIVPGGTSAEDVLALKPDGVFLSNGPGDPEAVTYGIAAVKRLVQESEETGLPVFGICLGHQIMGRALGADTYKLKFGHRGGNQPVKDLATGKVEITSQNHGFAVDANSLGTEVDVTHINLNDGTVEGLRHRRLPVFGVQYHPEASPGPHDAQHLFTRFTSLMDARKQ